VNAPDIIRYYSERGLVWPKDAFEALAWAHTELGEVYELLLARKDWVRNNPGDIEEFSPVRFAEELGDVLMMVVVAGLVENVDPFIALQRKMERKLHELSTADSDVDGQCEDVAGDLGP